MARKLRPHWLILPILLSGSVVAFSSLLMIGIVWPASPIANVVAGFLPIAEVHESRADAAMSGLRGAAPDWGRATQESWRELSIAPTHPKPWMRLAFIDAATHADGITPVGAAAIQHSYDFTPFDHDIGPWRLTFVYGHWDQMTPSIRSAALDETQMLWRFSSWRPQLEALPRAVANPAGQLAVTLALENLKAGAEP